MEKLVLIIGGNLGDRIKLIHETVLMLNQIFGFPLLSSSIFESSPWGGNSSGKYLNQVLVYNTDVNPKKVLELIQHIENSLGRKRDVKWGDRTMDIDIIYYGKKVMSSKTLTIPHPYISERKFVLEPLQEILPDFIHPVIKKSHIQLNGECLDKSEVKKYQKSPG
ncbi:2-amino-4-hydroxy-6-hydroxymethyldihydropteridine diphosphokinase [Shivajiella indica]|uniref:2-amino-4-hydroxy-6-hydroxymethyldihydropteridine pyrophosphokinase n=1 Tax=Shivajiella indica TaxID=872115 RepID=A0ABW5BCV6_9BACT